MYYIYGKIETISLIVYTTEEKFNDDNKIEGKDVKLNLTNDHNNGEKITI